MKKVVILLVLAFAPFLLINVSAEGKDKEIYEMSRFQASVQFYYNAGMTPNHSMEGASFGYRINKLVNLSLNGFGSSQNKAKLYGGTVTAELHSPKKNSFPLQLIPFCGFGYSYGTLDGSPKEGGFTFDIGVRMQYDLTDNIFCGFEMRSISFNKNSLYLFGCRLGYMF